MRSLLGRWGSAVAATLLADYFSPAELQAVRLSSKSHCC